MIGVKRDKYWMRDRDRGAILAITWHSHSQSIALQWISFTFMAHFQFKWSISFDTCSRNLFYFFFFCFCSNENCVYNKYSFHANWINCACFLCKTEKNCFSMKLTRKQWQPEWDFEPELRRQCGVYKKKKIADTSAHDLCFFFYFCLQLEHSF